MRIRRTGAKRGQKPVYYVAASTKDEVAAVEAGRLAQAQPDAQWTHVLAWGFPTFTAAQTEMDRLQPVVAAAIQEMQADGAAPAV